MQVNELQEYKEKYLKLKALFDEQQKEMKYKDKDLDFLRREKELQMSQVTSTKEQQIKELQELITTLRQNGRCVDPHCEDENCECKFDIQQVLDDNHNMAVELETINEEKNELVDILNRRDEEIQQIQDDYLKSKDMIKEMAKTQSGLQQQVDKLMKENK